MRCRLIQTLTGVNPKQLSVDRCETLEYGAAGMRTDHLGKLSEGQKGLSYVTKLRAEKFL